MIPLSAEFIAWKNAQSRAPIVILVDIEINDSTTLRYVMGDPTGTGGVTYLGETYTPCAYEIEEHEQDIRGDFATCDLHVSNINSLAAAYIEANEIQGQQVTITLVQLETLRT